MRVKLIVGLGNPETRYFKTRHNIGRMLVEYISRHEANTFSYKRDLKAAVSPFIWDDEKGFLAYPETYMNLSGDAVGALVRYYKIDFQKDLLVVVDDLALPFGSLRLRSKGSDGSHNGLKSIHQQLGSSEYPRLRIGIGHPSAGAEGVQCSSSVPDYVLSAFNHEEALRVPEVLEAGLKACRLWVLEPIEKAMSSVN